MSFTTIAFIVLATWGLIGAVTSIVMARRGHNPFSWFLLGAVFGPLVLAFVVEALADKPQGRSDVLHPGRQSDGPLSILVGIDGSEESANALRTAVALFESRVGRLTLAEVLDYETAQSTLPAHHAAAEAELTDRRREAAALSGLDADTILLAGRPAEALADAAVGGGYHLLVIGSRGRGATKAVLGSVARQLAGNSRVPILMVGRDAAPVGLGDRTVLAEFV
jgi:nucleotide-binding universal stress UspA family protein